MGEVNLRVEVAICRIEDELRKAVEHEFDGGIDLLWMLSRNLHVQRLDVVGRLSMPGHYAARLRRCIGLHAFECR